MRVKVVISYYNARSADPLIKLLDSMQAHTSGCAYTTQIVVNRAIDRDLVLPDKHAHHPILYRPNSGFNIGAWDQVWRHCTDSDFFLFLQDDCLVYRDNWLLAFVREGQKKNVGMVGESINWRRDWDELIGTEILEIVAKDHVLDGKPATRKEVYFNAFNRWNIEKGHRADHIQSIVWAARREVLERIDGFPLGSDYGEAIAAEIATSKKIQSAGMRIKQVHWRPFYYISHPEWSHQDSVLTVALKKLRNKITRNSKVYKILVPLYNLADDLKGTLTARLLKIGLRLSNSLEDIKGLIDRSRTTPLPATQAPNLSTYRVLFVDDNLPEPLFGAGYPRAKAFLQELIEAGCSVDHFSLARKSDEKLDFFQKVQPSVRFLSGSGLRGLRSLRLASLSAYDLVIVSRAITLNALIQTGWLQQESHKRPYRVVYDSEAITSVRKELRVKLYPLTLTERIVMSSKPDEWSMARHTDLISVVSAHDASLVQKTLAKPAVVVSYPVEVRTQVPGFDQRRDFLFVGRLMGTKRSVPNVDGLHWFLTKVLPLLQQSQLPKFKVHVVGAVNSPDLLTLSSETVRFYGKVDDLTSFYDAARVFIAPVRFAAGIPIKVLDAITNGLPAVAVPLLRYQLGLDETCPDSFPEPAAFAHECIRLYNDPEQWELERDIQRSLAYTRYSSTEFRKSIRQLLETARTIPNNYTTVFPDQTKLRQDTSINAKTWFPG